MAAKKLKVRMRPFILSAIQYTVGPDFQVACSGHLRYHPKYREGTRNYNAKVHTVRKVKIESPYGFNGKANKIVGSKQAKYALQLLIEACQPCILAT